jgi:hypothetical protein
MKATFSVVIQITFSVVIHIVSSHLNPCQPRLATRVEMRIIAKGATVVQFRSFFH